MAEWKQIRGNLRRISVGSVTNVWGVNSVGNIYRYTGDDANPWVQIPGPGGHLSDIGAAADGTVWVVNSVGNIYHYTWDEHPGSRFAATSRGSPWDLPLTCGGSIPLATSTATPEVVPTSGSRSLDTFRILV